MAVYLQILEVGASYIPSIPDSVKHDISKFNVNWKTQAKEIITHCNRELMHAVWKFLLDDSEFVHAARLQVWYSDQML